MLCWALLPPAAAAPPDKKSMRKHWDVQGPPPRHCRQHRRCPKGSFSAPRQTGRRWLGAPSLHFAPFAAMLLPHINFTSPTPSLTSLKTVPKIAGPNFDAFRATGLLSPSWAHLSHISAEARWQWEGDAVICYSWISSHHLFAFQEKDFKSDKFLKA